MEFPLSNGRSITAGSPAAPPGGGPGEGARKASVIGRPLLTVMRQASFERCGRARCDDESAGAQPRQPPCTA